MVEAKAIGEKLGVKFPIDVDRRLKGGGEVGDHKTSTLQDFEAGQMVELPALIGAVAELGRLIDVPTPTIDIVLALIQQRARVAGTY